VTDLVVPAKGLAISIQRRYTRWSGDERGLRYGWSVGVNVDLTVDPMNDVTFTLGGRRRTFYFTPQALYPQFAGLTTPAYTAEPGLPGHCNPMGGLRAGQRSLSFTWDVLMQYGLQWMCDWARPTARRATFTPTRWARSTRWGGRDARIDQGPEREHADGDVGRDYEQPVGGLVPFIRDGQGRITQITDTLGRNYLYGYDASGNLATVTFPGSRRRRSINTTPRTCDQRNRPPGNSNTSTYYADGRLQSITDAAGNTTQYAYDTTAHRTTVTNADGGTITTVTDAYGSPLSVTDPLGRTTTTLTTPITTCSPGPTRWAIPGRTPTTPTGTDVEHRSAGQHFDHPVQPVQRADHADRRAGQREDHGLRCALPPVLMIDTLGRSARRSTT